MTNDKKVYKKDVRYANANGEIKQWEESNVLNHQCSVAIDKAISPCQAGGGKYDFSGAAARLINEYGAERIKCVLANTVHNNYDGAEYLESSRTWAKANKINAHSAAGVSFYLHSDAQLVDGFLTAAKERFSELDKSRAAAKSAKTKPTLAERLNEGKRKAAAQGQSAPTRAKNKEARE